MKQACLFCEITGGKIPAHRIYEDANHLAILDIFPAVRGQALTMPKRHHGSYIFSMPEQEYAELMRFTREVSRRIDQRLGTIRTCMVMEGMEVDHAHIKLYPIHKVITNVARGTIDLNEYQGFISTVHGERMNDNELAEMARKIRGD
mgnify:CR=1 FL=1